MPWPTSPPSPLEPAAAACLERARSAVLNVLLAAGLGIAVSGFLLRGRERGTLWKRPEPARRGLFFGLLGLAISSHVVRRAGDAANRSAGREVEPGPRFARFQRSRLLASGLAALAVPLGLAYGWLIDPGLPAVCPFWVAALGLGFLAYPRAGALEGPDPLNAPDRPDPNEPTA